MKDVILKSDSLNKYINDYTNLEHNCEYVIYDIDFNYFVQHLLDNINIRFSETKKICFNDIKNKINNNYINFCKSYTPKTDDIKHVIYYYKDRDVISISKKFLNKLILTNDYFDTTIYTIYHNKSIIPNIKDININNKISIPVLKTPYINEETMSLSCNISNTLLSYIQRDENSLVYDLNEKNFYFYNKQIDIQNIFNISKIEPLICYDLNLHILDAEINLIGLLISKIINPIQVASLVVDTDDYFCMNNIIFNFTTDSKSIKELENCSCGKKFLLHKNTKSNTENILEIYNKLDTLLPPSFNHTNNIVLNHNTEEEKNAKTELLQMLNLTPRYITTSNKARNLIFKVIDNEYDDYTIIITTNTEHNTTYDYIKKHKNILILDNFNGLNKSSIEQQLINCIGFKKAIVYISSISVINGVKVSNSTFTFIKHLLETYGLNVVLMVDDVHGMFKDDRDYSIFDYIFTTAYAITGYYYCGIVISKTYVDEHENDNFNIYRYIEYVKYINKYKQSFNKFSKTFKSCFNNIKNIEFCDDNNYDIVLKLSSDTARELYPKTVQFLNEFNKYSSPLYISYRFDNIAFIHINSHILYTRFHNMIYNLCSVFYDYMIN